MPALPSIASNLPTPTTPLIGRDGEVSEAMQLLRFSHVRLLSLTGPGGVGKTRLSLEIAASLLGDAPQNVPDGVIFVALAPIDDPALVPLAIARALNIEDASDRPLTAILKGYLHNKQLLLV